jgi:UPF0755 protein
MEDLSPLDNTNFLSYSSLRDIFFKKKIEFCIIGTIIIFSIFYFLFFSAPSNFPVHTVINIQEGLSLKYISTYLEENHVIRSKTVFEIFVLFLGNEKYIASGDYLFENKIPVFEVAERMLKGERGIIPIKVTIPEGFNVSDIAKVSAVKLPDFNVNKFLLEATPKEGYLFPDTYFFLPTDNEQNVLEYMSDNFNKKISLLQQQIASSGKTENEIIVMASIIEKEAEGDTDRGFISGILWKRIALGIPLQVDADPVTYKVRGLPQSPICNPGMKAIEAAIYPTTSNYLYYLHDKGGNIHYASTYEQHKLNEEKYL